MKKNILIGPMLITLFFAMQGYGQNSPLQVTLHSRVDTTNTEVKQIAELYINYLRSTPDSVYNNPYWNNTEKLKYKNFDFSMEYLYQFPSNQLLAYYQPTILSIEKEGENYAIRTIFSADDLAPPYRSSNPWCITKIYAVKENNVWKLKNALPIITENWKRKKIGNITFIYPPHHPFNAKLAKKANLFCTQISKEFEFTEWTPFEFYITSSGDELGTLLNFDFFFAGYTTGIGMNDNRILLSGLGQEYYPHEFIHLIVPKKDRHWIIEEGFATWKGGVKQTSFEESAQILANEIELNPEITFWDVLDQKWGWQYAAAYVSGAIFCNAAYNKGGITSVQQLLETPNDNEKLIQVIGVLFEIEKPAINQFWKEEVLKYKNR